MIVRGSDIPLLPTNGPSAETLADYFAAGAVAVGVGAEVFPPGFTSESVEAAARRLRGAREALRVGIEPGVAARAQVTLIEIRRAFVQGLTCSWEGGQYVTLVAARGMVACGIFDPAVCERFDFAVAMAHGTPEQPLVEPENVLVAVIDSVSPRAQALGIEPGMTGREALEHPL